MSAIRRTALILSVLYAQLLSVHADKRFCSCRSKTVDMQANAAPVIVSAN